MDGELIKAGDFLAIRREDNVASYKILSLYGGISAAVYTGIHYFRLINDAVSRHTYQYLYIFLSLAVLSFFFRILSSNRFLGRKESYIDRIIFIYTILASFLLINVSVLDSENTSDFMAYAFAIVVFAFVYRTGPVRFILLNFSGLLYFALAYFLFHHRIVPFIILLPVMLFLCMACFISYSREKTKKKLFSLTVELEKSREELREMTLRDSLTGLYNRRFYKEIIPLQYDKFIRKGTAYSLILADIDNFKEINDKQGHNAGDEVLREIGELIRHSSRQSDIPIRFGGEEFLIVLCDTELPEAAATAERIRKTIEKKTFFNVPWQVTASLGVITSSEGLTPDSLFSRVDELMYEAKRGGRNRIAGI